MKREDVETPRRQGRQGFWGGLVAGWWWECGAGRRLVELRTESGDGVEE